MMESYTMLSMKVYNIGSWPNMGGKVGTKASLFSEEISFRLGFKGLIGVNWWGMWVLGKVGNARKYSQQKREHDVFKQLEVDICSWSIHEGGEGTWQNMVQKRWTGARLGSLMNHNKDFGIYSKSNKTWDNGIWECKCVIGTII